MKNLDNYLYIGSCRYQPLFKHFFPPRLHSTKEVIYFLNNFENLYFEDTIANFIYGGCRHPLNYPLAVAFRENFKFNSVDSVDAVICEICSNKVYMQGDVPFNAYLIKDLTNTRIGFQEIIMTKEDIYNDLQIIKDILFNKFNISKLEIITHVDLPLEDNKFIVDRRSLVENLEQVCVDLNIKCYSTGKIILKEYPNILLNTVLHDGFHYQNYDGYRYQNVDVSEIENIYLRTIYMDILNQNSV